ncbi:MAG: cyclic nucleotide-binding domain-containing protein [Prosthecobacter sp.]
MSAGAVIFSAGEIGAEMYIVKSGEVDLKVGDSTVETVGPNGFFGEMSLIEKDPRTATAVAKTDCLLVPIDQRRFEFMTHEVPFFAITVMRALSHRLRRADHASN